MCNTFVSELSIIGKIDSSGLCATGTVTVLHAQHRKHMHDEVKVNATIVTEGIIASINVNLKVFPR